jgi:hypothetical protein
VGDGKLLFNNFTIIINYLWFFIWKNLYVFLHHSTLFSSNITWSELH